jgi:HAD superfamily hydrolase (TIGR01459 family)
MAEPIVILPGLSRIAAQYDALICDVWGVLHDGRAAREPAVEALRAFRANHGPVILLSNAPRPERDLKEQFVRYGVPEDCYDAIMTSGMAARDDLERRVEAHVRDHGGRLPLLHLGPVRDRGVFAELAIDCVEPDKASAVLCTGLFDDDTETPEDYRQTLVAMKARGLTLLCANPDIKVQRGEQLIYCAGAIARLYEEMGGQAVYYGKPYRPIYDATMALAQQAAGRTITRALAIGDGLGTDIAGANAYGLDVLFIADGVHGEEIGELTVESLARLFAGTGASAVGAMPALAW